MNYEKKISFCMMVKNEEKNLERCLQSIQPILETGEAELIIVDTGSTDETMEIAKKYTAKLYEHPWNNNFSEMRNVSISYAVGEWIWIIDADEELQNPEAFIALFKNDLSGFNTITIKMKDYMRSSQGGEGIYVLNILKRGFRHTKEFHFEGAVHNQPISPEPIYSSSIVYGHYGYIFEDKEFAMRKFRRTAGILMRELQKQPDNIYYQFQLASSWANIDAGQSIIEYRKTYELIQKLSKAEQPMYLYAYGFHARVACELQNYYEAIRVCNEGILMNKEYIDLWYLGGKCYAALDELEKASEYYRNYLELLEIFDETEISKDSAFTFYYLQEKYRQEAFYQLGRYYLNIKNYNKAMEYAERLETSEYKNSLVVKASIAIGDYKQITEYFKQIQEVEAIAIDFLKQLEVENQRMENNPIEGRSYIEEAFSEQFQTYCIEKKDSGLYYSYCLLSYIRQNIKAQSLIQEELLACHINTITFRELPDFYGDILYYLMKNQYSMNMLVNLGRPTDLNRFLYYAASKYSDFSKVLYEYMDNNEESRLIDKVRFTLAIRRYALILNELDDACYREVFDKYVQEGIYYIESIYNKEILENEMIYDLKGEEEEFFLYMRSAGVQENVKQRIAYLNKALKAHPLVRGIKMHLEDIEQKHAKQATELEIYKVTIKENIKALIEQGEIEAAKRLGDSYQSIVTGDAEIYSLMAILAMMENNLDTALDMLNKGLEIAADHIDLLYNKAYLFELKAEYHNAIVEYKKIAKLHRYDTVNRHEADSNIERITRERHDELKNEKNLHNIYRKLDKIQRILFIDFRLSSDTNILATMLTDKGIDVDLAYFSTSPTSQFESSALPYSKMIRVLQGENLSEYIKNCGYDAVHVLNASKELKQQLDKCSTTYVDSHKQAIDINADIDKILDLYLQYKIEWNKSDDVNEQALLEQVAIIIPTFNREHYLIRTLEYFSMQFRDISPCIVILDSSDAENQKLNLKHAKAFDNLKVEYKTFDKRINFFDKLRKGLEKVHSKFVCLCADDDFITREGLLHSVMALQRDSSLVTVKGKNLYFVDSMSKVMEYDFFAGLYQDEPVERLRSITQGFVPSLFYQVFSTKKIAAIFDFIGTHKADLPEYGTFIEYMFYFMVILSGKVGKINVDLNIRDKGAPREEHFANFPNSLIQGSFNTNYMKFKESFITFAKLLKVHNNAFDRNVDEIFCAFLVNFLEIPREFVIIEDSEFNLKQLEHGMRKSWVWPAGL